MKEVGIQATLLGWFCAVTWLCACICIFFKTLHFRHFINLHHIHWQQIIYFYNLTWCVVLSKIPYRYKVANLFQLSTVPVVLKF